MPGCRPAPHRTVLALFTHTALQMDFCFQLCGAVPFTSFIRFCVRSMFPCYARPSVDPFPPAELPAFIGTMDRSDSLPLICPPSLLRSSGHTPVSRRNGRVSRVTCQSLCHSCHGLRPRRRVCYLAFAVGGCSLVDFRCVKNVVLLD